LDPQAVLHAGEFSRFHRLTEQRATSANKLGN